MAKRPTPARRPKAASAPLTDTQLDHVLDAIDAAIAGEDSTRTAALVEQLWPNRRRLPELLTQRVIAGRAAIPAFAFEMLGWFAGSKARSHLRRIAEDRTVADIVRFGAHRRAGWPERGAAKRRVAFLQTLRDPQDTLIQAIAEGSGPWPPDGEILAEVLEYLTVLPGAQAEALLTRALAGPEIGLGVAWLLHALLHVDAPALQRFALDDLVRAREPGALGAVQRLAATTRSAALRQEASAAARRLQLQVVQDEPEEPAPFPPFERVFVSLIDGSGGQVLLIVRQWAEGAFLFANFLFKDDWGIKDTFGSSHATPDDVDDIVEQLQEAGIALVAVDPAVVRGVMARAVEVNAATGHPIPPVFELWAPLVHESYPPPDGEPSVMPELDDTPFAGRRELVAAGRELAEHPFFESWGFEPEDVLAAVAGAPPPGRRGMTDRQYRPLIARLVDDAARARLCARLRRQAWLLEQAGDRRARDLALATAAQLAAATPDELAAQPFLRELVDHSITHALAGAILPF